MAIPKTVIGGPTTGIKLSQESEIALRIIQERNKGINAQNYLDKFVVAEENHGKALAAAGVKKDDPVYRHILREMTICYFLIGDDKKAKSIVGDALKKGVREWYTFTGNRSVGEKVGEYRDETNWVGKIKPTAVPPKVKAPSKKEEAISLGKDEIEIRSIYQESIQYIISHLYKLDTYSNFDDLNSLNILRDELSNEVEELENELAPKDQDSDAKKAVKEKYAERLSQDLLGIRANLSPYLQDAIGSDGSFNSTTIKGRIDGLITTTKALNEFETALNNHIAGETYDARKLGALKKNMDALNVLITLRYGGACEGLNAACDMLGIKKKEGGSATDQYLGVVGDMVRIPSSTYFSLTNTVQLRFPTACDELTSEKVPVSDPDNTPGLQRDAFDPFTRMAFYSAAPSIPLDRITDSRLRQMVLDAKFMPPATAGLLLGSAKFYTDVLCTVDEPYAREVVFKQAVNLLSDTYSNCPLAKGVHDNYETAMDLMRRFEMLTVSANLVTDMEASYTYGLERGHIGVKAPWAGRLLTTNPLFTSLGAFANNMLRPVSLIGTTVTPTVEKRGRLQLTNQSHIYDWAGEERRRYLNAMPGAYGIGYSYSQNYIKEMVPYGNVLAAMSEAYDNINKKKISSFSTAWLGVQALASGDELQKAGDLQWMERGIERGQSKYLELYGKTDVTKGSTYAPGKYSDFEMGKQTEGFMDGELNRINALGTNVWNGLLNYQKNTTKQLKDANGHDLSVGNLPCEDMNENGNAYLNSTFPGCKEGTTLAVINESRKQEQPTATAGGAEKKSYSDFDVNIFMKKGTGWTRLILEDEGRQLLKTQLSEKETLRDNVTHFFDQTYKEWRNRNIISAAGETDNRTLEWNPNNVAVPTDRRFGVMLLLQPGFASQHGDYAGGFVKTTTGDYALLFGGKENPKVIHGGAFAFNSAALPTISAGGVTTGVWNYYVPTYSLDEPWVSPTADKTYVTSATWLAIDRFRSTVFGGWNSQLGGILAGQDFRTVNANVSSFYSFDENGDIAQGTFSAGGKAKKLLFARDVSALAFTLHQQASATAPSREAGGFITSFKDKAGGTTTVAMNLDKDIAKQALTEQTISNLRTNVGELVDKINAQPAESWLQYNTRRQFLRDFSASMQNIAYQAIVRRPIDDIYAYWPVALTVGHKGPKGGPAADWVATAALTPDKKMFVSGLYNYTDRIGVIAGFRPMAPTAADATATSVLGTKVRLGSPLEPEAACSFFVSQTNDKKLIGTVDGVYKDRVGASVSAGEDYYVTHLSVGPDETMGIINFGKAGLMEYQEYGTRLAFGSAWLLAAAYGHVFSPGVSIGPGAFDLSNPLNLLAYQQGLVPEKIDLDIIRADILWAATKSLTFTGTGQLVNVRGKNTPLNFYGGIQANFNVLK